MKHYEQKIARAGKTSRTLDARLQIKSLDENGKFAGYASVFDVVDNQRDVVLRGAFRDSIAKRVSEIKLLWQHNQAEPIGVFDVMFEDERGLYVEGRLLLEVARAREAYALLKSGAVNGLSIGYTPVKYRMNPDLGVRELRQVELWEVSLVTFPANDVSRVTVVKGQACEGTKVGSYEDTKAGRHELIAAARAMEKMMRALI